MKEEGENDLRGISNSHTSCKMQTEGDHMLCVYGAFGQDAPALIPRNVEYSVHARSKCTDSMIVDLLRRSKV